MKRLVFLFVMGTIIFSLVKAQTVKINIREILQAEILSFKYNPELKSNEPLKIDFELINSGSIEYSARVRLDVMNDTDLLYVGWSDEVPLWPGVSSHFEIYWYPVNITGNFTGKIKIYLANEIKEIKTVNFQIKEINNPVKDIQITSFRTFEDRVEVNIMSNIELKDVVITASGYPYGWMFEQTKIDNIGKNEEKLVKLKYEPTIWKPVEITIHAFTEDGKQYASKTFLMEKEKPSSNILGYFVKILEIFSSFL